MRVYQVDSSYVKAHLVDDTLYRVSICDDGKNGKQHLSARLKPVKNMTIDEYNDSLYSSEYAFIVIEP